MIDNFYDLIVFALATWRLSSLLVNEEGPFLMFLRFRLMVGVIYIHHGSGEFLNKEDTLNEANDNGLVFCGAHFSNQVAKLFSCIWCTSVWVGLILVTLHELLKERPHEIFELGLIILSLSALAIAFECHVNKEDHTNEI